MGQDHILDVESLEFLVEGRKKTNAIEQLQEILTAPRDFAERYSLEITENVEDRFNALGKYNRTFDFPADDPVNTEAIHFFNKVVIDGRYIAKWPTEPENVADRLELQVSPEASQRIRDLRFQDMVNMDLIVNPGPFNIFWIILVVLVFIPSCVTYNFSHIVSDPLLREKV